MQTQKEQKEIHYYMKIEDYVQLKAFAKIDGALLALLWTASFACYILGTSSPFLMLIGMILAVCTPFLVGSRLLRFRNNVLNGTLTFKRGYAYSAHTFLYAALLFAVAQFVYFQFIDNGYIAAKISEIMSDPIMKQSIKSSGMEQAVNDAISAIYKTHPIDYALSYFTTNIIIGLILSLPIAGIIKKNINVSQK